VIRRAIGIGLIRLVLLDRYVLGLGVGGEGRLVFGDSVGYGI
jgi:hypothetical protein